MKKIIYYLCLIIASLFYNSKGFAQSDISGVGTGHIGGSNTSWYVGWDANTTFPLRIKTNADKAIEFYTNGGYRGKIGNSTEFSLIIGDGTTPLYNNIDINCVGNAPATEGYNYRGQLILSAPLDDNLLCGIYAGSNTTGEENVMVGYSAGNNNVGGTQNTFVGSQAGYYNSSANYNVFIGEQSGFNNQIGEQNCFTGAYSGTQNLGSYNTCNGYAAGQANTADSNTFVGCNSGFTNSTGGSNTMVGFESGKLNNTGYQNTNVGALSGYNTTTGLGNCFIGFQSGFTNTTGRWNTYCGQFSGMLATGSNNCFFGHHSGINCTGNNNVIMGYHAAESINNSNQNVIIGELAMQFMSNADKNTVVGSRAGSNHESGDENTFLGFRAGENTHTGYKNVFLGSVSALGNNAGYLNSYLGYNSNGSSSIHNATTIGSNTIVMNSNHMILGDDSVFVGIGLSGNSTGPRDKLEINTGISNVSGLQFTQLTSSYSPGSSATKFLTVDANGKVIMKDVPGSGGAVGACSTLGSTTQFVPKWSSLSPTPELCNSQIYDNGTNVDVGYSTQPVLHKLDINGNINLASTFGLYLGNNKFLSNGGSGGGNIYLGINAGPIPAASNSGFTNIAIGTSAGAALSTTEGFNTFVGNQAGENLTGTTSHNNTFLGDFSGVRCTTCVSNTFVGEYAGYAFPNDDHNTCLGEYASGYQSGVSGDYNTFLGPYTSVPANKNINRSSAIGYNAVIADDDAISLGASPTRILMGFSAPPTIDTTARLYVSPISGNRAAYFGGTVAAIGSYFSASDIRLKNNIQILGDVFPIIDQLSPKTFTFDLNNHPQLNLPSGIQYGFIAQELETVLPQLVETEYVPPVIDSLGVTIIPTDSFKAVNYSGLVPILVQGMKQQQNKIDSLIYKDSLSNARIDQLEQMIINCCNAPNQRLAKTSIDVELSNSIILNQNDPNPFAEETRISFNIPEGISNAKIIFFDNSNHIIQTVIINERGQSEIHVFASNLTSGIYNYSLVADGKVIDTKKMVCNK